MLTSYLSVGVALRRISCVVDAYDLRGSRICVLKIEEIRMSQKQHHFADFVAWFPICELRCLNLTCGQNRIYILQDPLQPSLCCQLENLSKHCSWTNDDYPWLAELQTSLNSICVDIIKEERSLHYKQCTQGPVSNEV